MNHQHRQWTRWMPNQPTEAQKNIESEISEWTINQQNLKRLKVRSIFLTWHMQNINILDLPKFKANNWHELLKYSLPLPSSTRWTLALRRWGLLYQFLIFGRLLLGSSTLFLSLFAFILPLPFPLLNWLSAPVNVVVKVIKLFWQLGKNGQWVVWW